MASVKEAADLAQFLTFSVADEEYGISVLRVREILEYDTITRVPRTPEFIRGVINLRGRVVPVVDLAVRFGMPPSPVTKRSCVVIVEVVVEGEPVVMGLVADAVNQVIELGEEDIEPPPSFGTRVDVAYLKGMGRADKRFVLLLEIERVLSSDEAQEVAAVGAEAPPPAPSSGGAARIVASLLLALALGRGLARAEEPIQDNSFLIEEAYNQERGVVQHISAFSRAAESGDWLYTFSQEWPLPDQHHQLSFTLPVQQLHATAAIASTGVGDAALNYRYQALGVSGGPVAFAPRVSLLVPTGSTRTGLGSGGAGFQVNLPLSWEMGSHFVSHWNAGATHTLQARDAAGAEAGTNSFSAGQSLVWLARPKVNLLVETVWVRAEAVTGPGATSHSDALFVSPGVRWAVDVKGLQIVPGIAFPIGVGPSSGQHALFLYLSLEHTFRRSH
ncbi:MAG TPA: chemotaxis protein CheW [Vicinamibacteria bacterium]|nr:chemotaxis protein CheW [Vicinamibacteria bacterium]